jgi:hypothetical protein
MYLSKNPQLFFVSESLVRFLHLPKVFPICVLEMLLNNLRQHLILIFVTFDTPELPLLN